MSPVTHQTVRDQSHGAESDHKKRLQAVSRSGLGEVQPGKRLLCKPGDLSLILASM